jgi:hypothetical protein
VTMSSSVITINAVPLPAVPTASSTIQPTCGTPSGTIVVSTQTGVEEYSLTILNLLSPRIRSRDWLPMTVLMSEQRKPLLPLHLNKHQRFLAYAIGGYQYNSMGYADGNISPRIGTGNYTLYVRKKVS